MSKRFFVECSIDGPEAELIGPEAHHLIHVMRASVGDEVVLWDGSGAEFSAKVVQIGRSNVDLEVGQRQDVDRELPFSLTLGVALPKGDRQRWLVEKCTELGTTCLVPLITKRGIAQPGENGLNRLRRTVIETCKQCGRNRLMKIAPPSSLEAFLTDTDKQACRLLASPGGDPISNVMVSNVPIFVAIGPEGGFTDDELAVAQQANWQKVSLGKRILRVETAAIALAARFAFAGES